MSSPREMLTGAIQLASKKTDSDHDSGFDSDSYSDSDLDGPWLEPTVETKSGTEEVQIKFREVSSASEIIRNILRDIADKAVELAGRIKAAREIPLPPPLPVKQDGKPLFSADTSSTGISLLALRKRPLAPEIEEVVMETKVHLQPTIPEPIKAGPNSSSITALRRRPLAPEVDEVGEVRSYLQPAFPTPIEGNLPSPLSSPRSSAENSVPYSFFNNSCTRAISQFFQNCLRENQAARDDATIDNEELKRTEMQEAAEMIGLLVTLNRPG